ncbi:hypothetical protein GCM10007984_21900 [Shewanella putrefaciens]|nr:hypothetical protein GCM10007984_21900 [Shewanella putrefaciens]
MISNNYLSNCIKTATAKKQIPIASFIPIYTDVAAAIFEIESTSDLCPANSAAHKY